MGGPSSRIDRFWHRETVLRDHLSRVLAAAPTAYGGFHHDFDRAWRPRDQGVHTATMQGRVVYALAQGYLLTRDEAYREAMARGADYLVEVMGDPVGGGFYEATDAAGRVVDDTKRLYSQAFAIFGLAHAYRVSGNRRYLQTAEDAWDRVSTSLKDLDGGFVQAGDRYLVPLDGALSQNPLMHLFEALLALYDAGAPIAVLGDAAELADFVATRLVRHSPHGRYIPEYYEPGWVPMADTAGGYIDLGHQVEWAFLLSEAVERGLPESYLGLGNGLLNFALKSGYDEAKGGLSWRTDYAGNQGQEKVWWVQSELLRTLMRYGVRHGRDDLWPRYDQTLEWIRGQFLDPASGGWYPLPADDCREPECRDRQPDVGYHIVAMHVEAVALARR
jgi:mannose-6-phosphate isomerase